MGEPVAGFESHDAAAGLVCPACGYSLFGIDSQRCPECGLAIDRTALGQSQLPWAHGRQIGRVRAFWRTVRLVTFRPSRLALEVNHPVSLHDARLFRRICVLIAWIPLMAWAIGWLGWQPWIFGEDLAGVVRWERGAAMGIAAVTLALFLFGMTGLPMYFFHPASMPVLRQNRALALSHYLAGNLVWLALMGLLPAPLPFFNNDYDHMWQIYITGPLLLTTCLSATVLLFVMISSPIRLLKGSTHCSASRCWTMGLTLLPACAVLAGLCFAVIPAIVVAVALVVRSLR